MILSNTTEDCNLNLHLFVFPATESQSTNWTPYYIDTNKGEYSQFVRIHKHGLFHQNIFQQRATPPPVAFPERSKYNDVMYPNSSCRNAFYQPFFQNNSIFASREVRINLDLEWQLFCGLGLT